MDRLAISIGILGGVLGYMAGTRMARSPNESTPIVTAGGMGLVFYMVAYELMLVFAVVCAALGTFFFFRDVWPRLSEVLLELSRGAGLQLQSFLPEEVREDSRRRETRLDELDDFIHEIAGSSELTPHEKSALIQEYRQQQRDLLD